MRGVGMESAVSAVIAILRKKKKGISELKRKAQNRFTIYSSLTMVL